MKTRTVYRPEDRPEAEVEVDGTWYYGEVRMWSVDDDGTWHAQVKWSAPDGNRIDTFPQDRVRQSTAPEDPRNRLLRDARDQDAQG